MGCGCKKKTNQPSTTSSSGVTVKITESTPNQNTEVQTNQTQQQQLDAIIAKIDQINTNLI
jgi:hypothetical protein